MKVTSAGNKVEEDTVCYMEADVIGTSEVQTGELGDNMEIPSIGPMPMKSEPVTESTGHASTNQKTINDVLKYPVKVMGKDRHKDKMGEVRMGNLRIGSIQINSLTYDKLENIIRLWKEEKYDYLAITDTRCITRDVPHLKKLLR